MNSLVSTIREWTNIDPHATCSQSAIVGRPRCGLVRRDGVAVEVAGIYEEQDALCAAVFLEAIDEINGGE